MSADGGSTWRTAELGDAVGHHAWRSWSFEWDAQPGTVELCCRAADGAGNEQPLQPSWNLGGFSNNAVQRVPSRSALAGSVGQSSARSSSKQRSMSSSVLKKWGLIRRPSPR